MFSFKKTSWSDALKNLFNDSKAGLLWKLYFSWLISEINVLKLFFMWIHNGALASHFKIIVSDYFQIKVIDRVNFWEYCIRLLSKQVKCEVLLVSLWYIGGLVMLWSWMSRTAYWNLFPVRGFVYQLLFSSLS